MQFRDSLMNGNYKTIKIVNKNGKSIIKLIDEKNNILDCSTEDNIINIFLKNKINKISMSKLDDDIIMIDITSVDDKKLNMYLPYTEQVNKIIDIIYDKYYSDRKKCIEKYNNYKITTSNRSTFYEVKDDICEITVCMCGDLSQKERDFLKKFIYDKVGNSKNCKINSDDDFISIITEKNNINTKDTELTNYVGEIVNRVYRKKGMKL